jgi:uncharacterized protein (TIGR03086 family)
VQTGPQRGEFAVLSLEPPADQIAALARNLPDEQLNAPTPCPGTDVGAMLAHVLQLSVAFRDAARKVDGPTTSTPPGTVPLELPSDWRDALPRRLSELTEAWRDPAAWEGDTKAGGLEMPGADTGFVANDELVLHGWDLAVATGQPFEVAEPNLEASWQFASSIPDDQEAREGLFGPVVDVPQDASLLDRTLGQAGRDPRWSPAA